MSDEQSPLWLESVLSRVSTPPVGFPEEGEWPLVASPGEIRAARPMDQERLGARLILVLEAYTEGDPWVNACLLGGAVEAAGDRDIRLDPEDTELSFPALVETDVVGPLFMAQLGPLLGEIELSFLDELKAAVYGEWSSSLANRRGVPIVGRHEARWRLKEDEIAAMHALGHAYLEHYMKTEVEETVPDAVLDPAFFTEVAGPSLPTMLRVLSVVEKEGIRRPDVPTEGPLENTLRQWAASLGPDEVRALEPIWQGCLRADKPQIDSSERHLEWTYGWNAPAAEVLARRLAQRALAGERAFRVLTPRKHWLKRTSGGVVALDVEGVGRVQVKPELIEEAA